MTVILIGLVLFFSAFFIHVLIWRICLPYRQTKVLLLIFFSTFMLWFLSSWLFPSFFLELGLPVPTNFYGYLHILLLFTSLTLAYITTYSGLEVDSPSIVMTMIIEKAGREGISKEDFEKALTDDILVTPRVQDLLRDNLAYLVDGRYRITPKGVRLVRSFIFYCKVLNVKEKGG